MKQSAFLLRDSIDFRVQSTQLSGHVELPYLAESVQAPLYGMPADPKHMPDAKQLSPAMQQLDPFSSAVDGLQGNKGTVLPFLWIVAFVPSFHTHEGAESARPVMKKNCSRIKT